MSVRIGVLASGGGSNLQALIDHFSGTKRAIGEVVWVGCNKQGAGALTRAADAGIATHHVTKSADGDSLLEQLNDHNVQLLVLAGYLRLVPSVVVRAYSGALLNIHPALLPAFGGAGMFGMNVHEAVVASGATVTGATVHYVTEQYDRGAIVAQWPVPVFAGDSAHAVASRVLRVEHRLLPLCVELVARGEVKLSDSGERITRSSYTPVSDDAAFVLSSDHVSQNRSATPEVGTDITSLLFP